MRKSPHAVGRSTVSPFSTMDSSFSRYEISDAIEMILRSNFLAISISCGRRAIVPSSFMISISAPAGCKPASRARSIAASVCPGRRSTPFWRARRGLICPGRPKSVARVAGSASARIVAARSWIETPVVQSWPSRSTVTVKGVPSSEVLFSSIMLRPSSAQRSSESGAQSTPRPSLSMKFTISGVIFSAATMKSPSFSRSSSSTTITICRCGNLR